MRERRAVSSFFLDRLTLIRRLPGGSDCEFCVAVVSLICSILWSLVLRREGLVPDTKGSPLFRPSSYAFLIEALTAASVLLS